MQVLAIVEFTETRSGWIARAPQIGLSASAATRDGAVAQLERAVTAFCRGLARGGELDDVLKRRRVKSEPNEAGGIEVSLHEAGVTPSD